MEKTDSVDDLDCGLIDEWFRLAAIPEFRGEAIHLLRGPASLGASPDHTAEDST
jgi:hypothetical protein